MTVAWRGQCKHCREMFPMEEAEAHQVACEARTLDRFKTMIERPRTWSYDVGLVREVYVETPTGSVRKFFVGTTDQLITRAQMVGLRDLITLALEESPDAVAATPMPPAPVPDATGAA
jgi:hypothetical protein